MTKFRIFLCLLLLIHGSAGAEPTGQISKIVGVRPYIGGLVFIDMDKNSPCDTNVYKLTLANPGGRENYAAALLAFAMGASVYIEVLGCSGWASNIQSIRVVKDPQ